MEELFKKIDANNATSLRYEELSQWEVGRAVINEAINRWEQLGFLALIDDDIVKEKMAVAFDNMALDLLYENERVVKIQKRYNFNCAPDNGCDMICSFDVIVFPILRRVISKVDNFNYDKFLDYLEKLSFLAINYDGYEIEECDIEAEFCALLSTAIVEMFKNEKVSNK